MVIDFIKFKTSAVGFLFYVTGNSTKLYKEIEGDKSPMRLQRQHPDHFGPSSLMKIHII